MYQTVKDPISKNPANCVIRTTDGACIPFDVDNSDYAQFKKDILDGAELLDADGQVLDAIQFVKELP